LIIAAVLAVLPSEALASGSSTSQITQKAPSRLSKAQQGNLPMTGSDLLPEAVVGLALVGAGVGLRVRRKH